MAQMLLTTKFVESVKPNGKKQGFSDSKSPNLMLIVQKGGTKTWVWRGRFDGQTKTITLGPFPLHDLNAARTWADNITTKRDEGINIVAEQAKDVEERDWISALTCDRLFEIYIENDGSVGERWKKEKARIWKHDIQPTIGKKLATEIDHDTLMGIIRKKHKEAPTSAIHIKNLLCAMFKWAVKDGRDLTKLIHNPATDLVKLGKVTKRARFLDQYEIGLFFKALPMTASVMAEPTLVILYTGVRREEGFNAPWSEFNLEKGEWLIAEDRSKNGLEHLLPLPPVIVDLLRERKKLTGNHTFVWPSSRGDRPMTGFSKWLKLLRQKMNWLASKDGKVVAPFTLHDLRRTLSTGMNGLRDSQGKRKVAKDIIERVLNHKIGGVEGIYDRNDYYEDKQAALLHWASYLQDVRDLFEVDKLPAPLLALPAPQNDESSVAAA